MTAIPYTFKILQSLLVTACHTKLSYCKCPESKLITHVLNVSLGVAVFKYAGKKNAFPNDKTCNHLIWSNGTQTLHLVSNSSK